MDEQEIRFLGDLQRIQPQPGDVFVLTVEQSISYETAERLRSMVGSALNGAKMLVLSDGVRLECVAAPSEA